MKILEFIPQLGSGGAERFVVDLSNELSAHNTISLYVFHPLNTTGFYEDELSKHIKIHTLNKKPGVDLLLPFRVFNIIKKEKPDVVHTHLNAVIYMILSIIFFRKVRFFHTVHNTADVETEGFVGSVIRKILFKLSLVTPVTISRESKSSFVDYYNIEPKLISNGRNIPSDIVVSDVVRNEVCGYKKTLNTKVIVHLAHIGHQKRQDVMARVVDRLSHEGYDISLIFIGKVCEQKMAEDIEALHNDRIHIIGLRKNPLEYLKMADAFALCSSYEGLPISLIETIGIGTIPICTPVGGIVDIIRNGYNGFLSEDISEESYYKAVKSFLDTSDEDLAIIKQNVKASYKPYSMTECASKYFKLFFQKD